ncbi:MAG: CHASE domain-containing protein, partial [Pseudomonadales bacterium]|nr:CHASE domain-containing protein [Pseudomonadales bacterium]
MNERTPRLTLSNTTAMTLNLVVAVLYLLFGLSAEFLSIPPDYATPVWPAAGIALGFALRYGAVVYPGIFLGALLANSIIAYLQGIPFSFDQFGFAALIATGATIQAAFARYLLTKAKISPTQLRNGNEIAKFLLLAGPASCMVNSINGATLLGLFNIVPWDFWFTNWLTWWVGDSVGALVITPFALRILSGDTKGKQTWNAALMSITFLGLVILSFLYVRELEQENRKAQVAETGDHMAVIFKSHIYEMSVILGSLKAFYESSSFVDLDEFNHFSSVLMKYQKAIHVLEWLPYITHDKRADLEAYLRENGYPNFKITKRELNGALVEQDEQPDYMPIAYAYPYEGNEKIHGMDVLSLPYREPQSRLALETGKAYASAPLKLVQEEQGQTAYILLKPIENYQGEGYTGLVQTIFRVNDLIDETMGLASDLEGLTITDITEPTKPTIIYGTKHKPSDYSWHQEFEFLNRKLSVSLTPSLSLLKRVSSWQSYTLLIGGLLYVAMLEAVLLSLLTRQHAIQLEVDTKTREIAQAKEEAERASKAKTDFLASMSHELRT